VSPFEVVAVLKEKCFDMRFILVIILVIIFCLLHRTGGLKKVLWIYIASFILLGGLNEKKYSYFLEPADWITLIIFISIFIYGLAQKRKYISEINWPDKLLLFYFTFTLYLPIIINLIKPSLNPYSYLTFFMPMRIWFVYRVFFYALSEAHHRKNNDLNFDYIINAILIIGSISALIAILRYFPIPYLQDFIEDTWPITKWGGHASIEYWKRLWGTSGGTNTTGNLFGILLLFSLYRFKLDKRFIVFSCLFFICVLLSGSFSTMAGLIIILVFFFREYVSKKLIITAMAIILLGSVVIYKVPVLSDAVGTRFAKRFYAQSEFNIMPNNLQKRLGYWQVFTNTLLNKRNGIFGFGPGGMRNDPASLSFHGGNPESFYFRILGDSGFIGLSAFIIMIWFIFKRIRLLKINGRYKEEALIIGIVIMFYLVTGVANETLYSGACTEIFGIILCFIYLMVGKSVSYLQMSSFKRHVYELKKRSVMH